MPKTLPIFYSALLLTLVNLLLRAAGTSFQVFISSRIGAAGVGLLQLVMSVSTLALVAGMAGVRTAAMYLTAEELGRRKLRNVSAVLSGCFLYSILCSGAIGLLLYLFAPRIAQTWIGDIRTGDALRLFSCFLPVICLCGVMSGYFTAAKRIGMLAAVEVGEQLVSMGITLAALSLWADADPARACVCVILGSCIGSCFTLLCLILLRCRERPELSAIPVRGRLTAAAVPLALADILKSGISTTENLMVPGRLGQHSATKEPLAAFGIVSGMVFPVLMFPACILFGLNELLIPELARSSAAGNSRRISYLVRKCLRIAMLYGLLFGGLEFLLAELLCLKLYQNPEAGDSLRLYALMIPMLYCDAVTDAMTKGLGQQKICVRYNILTSALDVVLLYFLLPIYGMKGYFVSFFLTHALNFMLSLFRLLRITREHIPFYIPVLSLSAAMASALAAAQFSAPIARAVVYPAAFGSLLYLFRVADREDIRWIRGLIRRNDSPSAQKGADSNA